MCRLFLVLCLFLSLPASAEDPSDPVAILLKGNNLQESDCPELVRFLNNQSVSKQERHEDAPITVALSYHILVLGCPMQFMTTPINALHRSEISATREDVSVSLGAAYEHGVRVDRDLDEARYWYRKLAYRHIGKPEFYLKFTRQRIERINPIHRIMSSENWSAALDNGELASEIFEKELLAVQKLMNGPVSGIVRASKHLYHGTGGFPRDKEIAKKILYDAARAGEPEAQYAFAIALLDRRFFILGQERQFQLMQAETFLMKAVSQRYLPAILKLASICESTTNWHNDVAAYALYRKAAREGATGFEKQLERLRARNQLYLDSELERIERWINDGVGPACY